MLKSAKLVFPVPPFLVRFVQVKLRSVPSQTK